MPKTISVMLTLAAGWLFSSQAVAQPLRTVAVVDVVKFPAKATQAHARLRAAVEESLPSKNWFLAETSRPIADCGMTPEGLAKVARDTSAQYVLRIFGQKNHEYGYEITLHVYSTVLAGVRSSLATCDICDPGRMAEVAGKAAGELLAGVVKEETSFKEKSKQQVVAAAPPPVAAPLPPPTAVLVTPPPVPAARKLDWVPWTLIGVGAVALGYGAYAIYEDGKTTGTNTVTSTGATRERYASQTLGIVGVTGGGLLALAGAIWIITTPSQAATVSLSPNHVALNVRF